MINFAVKAAACLLLFLVNAGLGAQSSKMSLAEVLAAAEQKIGPAPSGLTTPFFIASVTRVDGDSCYMQIATNGTLYFVRGTRSFNECYDLPQLYSLVWGKVRRAGFKYSMSHPNVQTSDLVLDLAYTSNPKQRAATYMIYRAEAIDSNWGQ